MDHLDEEGDATGTTESGASVGRLGEFQELTGSDFDVAGAEHGEERVDALDFWSHLVDSATRRVVLGVVVGVGPSAASGGGVRVSSAMFEVGGHGGGHEVGGGGIGGSGWRASIVPSSGELGIQLTG